MKILKRKFENGLGVWPRTFFRFFSTFLPFSTLFWTSPISPLSPPSLPSAPNHSEIRPKTLRLFPRRQIISPASNARPHSCLARSWQLVFFWGRILRNPTTYTTAYTSTSKPLNVVFYVVFYIVSYVVSQSEANRVTHAVIYVGEKGKPPFSRRKKA